MNNYKKVSRGKMVAGKEGTNQESEFGKVLIYTKNQKFALVGEGGMRILSLNFQFSDLQRDARFHALEMENCAHKPI
jgi:hypothetical protein